MRFQKPQQKKRISSLQPILPLVRVVLQEEEDKNKARYISFDLKVNADGAVTPPKYKKMVKTFEGSPQEWFDFLSSNREIWSQNRVNKASDRSATVAAILKGDSLIAYESALAGKDRS